MRLLVTSAAGANGEGYGALLAFDRGGRPEGAFSNDARIADPRGLAIENDAGLLFLNSGANRVLALDARGKIVRDSGPIDGLNPGGGVFGLERAHDPGASQWSGRRACSGAGNRAVSARVCLWPRRPAVPRVRHRSGRRGR